MRTNIEYSCHTITNIKHGRRLSLQLMINSSFICNYSNACLVITMHIDFKLKKIYLLKFTAKLGYEN